MCCCPLDVDHQDVGPHGTIGMFMAVACEQTRSWQSMHETSANGGKILSHVAIYSSTNHEHGDNADVRVRIVRCWIRLPGRILSQNRSNPQVRRQGPPTRVGDVRLAHGVHLPIRYVQGVQSRRRACEVAAHREKLKPVFLTGVPALIVVILIPNRETIKKILGELGRTDHDEDASLERSLAPQVDESQSKVNQKNGESSKTVDETVDQLSWLIHIFRKFTPSAWWFFPVQLVLRISQTSMMVLVPEQKVQV